MLVSLQVQNYALIKELKIGFGSGFSIITGETGAGKSILLGALSLLIGQRADTTVMMDKQKKCVVEGVFEIKEYDLHLTLLKMILIMRIIRLSGEKLSRVANQGHSLTIPQSALTSSGNLV
jgi:DNA repair ATPase RecN